jgi:hypothetical protein
MNSVWLKSGNDYHLGETTNEVKLLPPNVYKVVLNPTTGELYITESAASFLFPFKVYGLEDKFVKRVIKTYNNISHNLGILLNGVKGTGKTVTAQKICNELNLPVLIVTEHYDNLPNFLNDIEQSVIVFFDEYEKMYHHNDNSDGNVLSLMDGVLSTVHKKVFLLTTNNAYLNQNMLQRPGRLRYLRTFGDLDKETVLEIVNDKLIYPEHKEALIGYISTLELITVDIVKSLTEEVNIHNETPEEFKGYFNVKPIEKNANVYIKKKGKWEIKYENEEIKPYEFEEYEDFYVRNVYIGTILQVTGDIISVQKGEGVEDFKIERLVSKHRSFLTEEKIIKKQPIEKVNKFAVRKELNNRILPAGVKIPLSVRRKRK